MPLSTHDVIYAMGQQDLTQLERLFKTAKAQNNWEVVKFFSDIPDNVKSPDGMIPNPYKPAGAKKELLLNEIETTDAPIGSDLHNYLYNLERVFLIDDMRKAIDEDDATRIHALFNKANEQGNWEVIELVCVMANGPNKPLEVSHSFARSQFLQDAISSSSSLDDPYTQHLKQLFLIEDIKEAIQSNEDLDSFFVGALKTRNWKAIKLICDQPDGPNKPALANYDELYRATKEEALSGNREAWNVLYELMRAFFEDNPHQLEAGPLPKSVYTIQLEAFFRELMAPHGGNFTISHPTPEDDVYLFPDTGNTYNWTLIRNHADFTHLNLNDDDFAAYTRYKNSDEFKVKLPPALVRVFTASNLVPSSMDHYLNGLYYHYDKQYGPGHRPPILLSFEEMQSLANYTGEGAYTIMNALTRGEIHDESWFMGQRGYSQSQGKEAIRAGLIESVLCSHGLGKLPEVEVKDAYRGKGTSPDDVEYYIEKAAKKEVMSFVGFTSTSVDKNTASNWALGGMLVHIINPKGVYIAPISKNKDEREFLIPPTEVQCIGYQNTPGFGGTLHIVDFTVVADLAHLRALNPERLLAPNPSPLSEPEKVHMAEQHSPITEPKSSTRLPHRLFSSNDKKEEPEQDPQQKSPESKART